MPKHRHRWTLWRPLGNGHRIYNRECQNVGCKKFEELNLDYTDFDMVQRWSGGFKLVKVPGKGFAQIMAEFNYISQALWLCSVAIAGDERGDLQAGLFFLEWVEAILFHQDE